MRLDPKEIIKQLKINEGRIRKTARDLGISPSTVWRWARRAGTGRKGHWRFQGLKRRSTAPKTVRQTSLNASDQDSVKALRKESDYGARKLVYLLGLDKHPQTIHRFLKKQGLVSPSINYRRPLFQPTKHMHARNVTTIGKLQMDVKYVTPELSGLEHTAYLYAVIDIFSRYKQAIVLPLLDQRFAISALGYLLDSLPLRADFIQTDNGLEFQKDFVEFSNSIGLAHHYIHKSSPNENAVIERSFRTDQDEFFYFRLRKWGRPRSIQELNELYQRYITIYNTERPHQSLNYATPLEIIIKSSVS